MGNRKRQGGEDNGDDDSDTAYEGSAALALMELGSPAAKRARKVIMKFCGVDSFSMLRVS